MIKFLDLENNPAQKEKYLVLFMKMQVNAFNVNNNALGIYTP
jgi:hypothetical protein